MDSIIASIHPEWWEKIKSGEKTLEIRKTRPTKVSFPFKIIWYVTGSVGIVGESICPEIIWDQSDYMPLTDGSCLTQPELWKYAGECEGTAGIILYGWRLTRTIEYYERPATLFEYGLKRPPQSWQYYFIDFIRKIGGNA